VPCFVPGRDADGEEVRRHSARVEHLVKQ
jgi:hypothetical protein